MSSTEIETAGRPREGAARKALRRKAPVAASVSEARLTMSIPEAGKRYFGLSRNGSYDAAARGEIPTIKIGRLLRAPVLALERMIERHDGPLGTKRHLRDAIRTRRDGATRMRFFTIGNVAESL